MLIKESITIRAGTNNLIQNSELAINKNIIYGLVGNNGCGKTTLLNYIRDKYDTVYVEQMLYDNTQSIEEAILNKNTKLIELMTRLNYAYKEDNDEMISIAEKNLYDEYNIDKEKAIIKKLLRGLGIDHGEKLCNELSGGERMKIMLVGALYMMNDKTIMNSHILLLDEPTNHLDINNVLFITKYLKEEFKGTLIMASHDRYILDAICTNIIHINELEKKLVYYKGNYTKFLWEFDKWIVDNNKRYEKTRNRVKEMRRKGISKDIVDKFLLDNDFKKIDCEHEKVKLRFCGETNFRLMNKANYILNANNIMFQFKDKMILNKLNLNIYDCGYRMAIIGENGVGKSTLLKVLSGKLEKEFGDIRWCNGIKISYFDQNLSDNLDALNAIDCVRQINNTISDFEIHRYLGNLGLKGCYHKVAWNGLSGGQKSRVALARMMVSCPDVLLLDEITNHLDVMTCNALIDAVNNFQGPVILVSHNLDFIIETKCRVFELVDYRLNETTIEEYQQKIWDNI